MLSEALLNKRSIKQTADERSPHVNHLSHLNKVVISVTYFSFEVSALETQTSLRWWCNGYKHHGILDLRVYQYQVLATMLPHLLNRPWQKQSTEH